MSVELRVLKACNGDCIWVRYGKERPFSNILIDSGPKAFQRGFRETINKIKQNNEKVDLVIITHIDDDHLGGFSKWISDPRNDISVIKKIWFNTGELIKEYLKDPHFATKNYPVYFNSSDQQYTVGLGKEVSHYLVERGISIEPVIKAGHVESLNGAKLTVLSPSKEKLETLLCKWGNDQGNTEYSSSSTHSVNLSALLEKDKFSADTSPYNGSSIAFIFEYGKINIAFLADAHVSTVIESKNIFLGGEPLVVDIMKLSHHGGSLNTSVELLKSIQTNNYIVSTNGSNNNPDKKTIARILSANEGGPIYLFSNYDWWSGKKIFTNNDFEVYIKPNLLNRIELTSDLVYVNEGLVIGNA